MKNNEETNYCKKKRPKKMPQILPKKKFMAYYYHKDKSKQYDSDIFTTDCGGPSRMGKIGRKDDKPMRCVNTSHHS